MLRINNDCCKYNSFWNECKTKKTLPSSIFMWKQSKMIVFVGLLNKKVKSL